MRDGRLDEALRHLHPPPGAKAMALAVPRFQVPLEGLLPRWLGGGHTRIGTASGRSRFTWLTGTTPWSGDSRKPLITGIVLHDTYHAGHIQMLKRMAVSHGP